MSKLVRKVRVKYIELTLVEFLIKLYMEKSTDMKSGKMQIEENHQKWLSN